MNLEDTLARETQFKADLAQAQEDYKKKSLKLRVSIGQEIAVVRERLGLSRQQMANLLRTNRQKIFSSEHPESVINPFSVQEMAETYQLVQKLERLMSQAPTIGKKSGRPSRK